MGLYFAHLHSHRTLLVSPTFSRIYKNDAPKIKSYCALVYY